MEGFDLKPLESLISSLRKVESYQQIVATEGISRDTFLSIDSFDPTILEGLNPNKYTIIPSKTNIVPAIEALDWKKGTLIVSIIVGVLAILRKLYSTVVKASLDYNDAVTASDVIDVMETTKDAVAPTNIEEIKVDSKDGLLFKRIKAQPDSPLNPVIRVIIRQHGTKFNEKQLLKAIDNLESLYNRIGEDGLAVCMALALDTESNKFNDSICYFKAMKDRDFKSKLGQYSGTYLDVFDNIIVHTDHIMDSLDGVVNVLKAGGSNFESAILQIEKAMYAFNNTWLMSKAAPFESMATLAAGFDRAYDEYALKAYKIKLTDEASNLIRHVTERQFVSYSIYPSDDSNVRNVRDNFDYFKALTDKSTIKELGKEVEINTALAKRVRRDIEKALDRINSFERSIGKLSEEDLGYMIDFGQDKLAPADYIKNRAKLLFDINQNAARYHMASSKMRELTIKTLEAIVKGGKLYQQPTNK